VNGGNHHGDASGVVVANNRQICGDEGHWCAWQRDD